MIILKFISQVFCLYFFSANLFAQENTNYSCPLYKGKIISNKNASGEWGKTIAQAEIKSRKTSVYSISQGIVTGVDTSFDGKLNVSIESGNYVFIYDNMETISLSVGQKIEKGELLGKLKKNDFLLLRIKDDLQYVDPKAILPCKKIKGKLN